MSRRKKARVLVTEPCACGCGQTLVRGEKSHRRFLDDAHRQRHHRERLQRLAKEAGVPARVSIETLKSAGSTNSRSRNAEERRGRRVRRPREGLSVYVPSVELVEAAAAVLRRAGGDELGPAVEALERALERRRRRDAGAGS